MLQVPASNTRSTCGFSLMCRGRAPRLHALELCMAGSGACTDAWPDWAELWQAPCNAARGHELGLSVDRLGAIRASRAD